MVALINAREVDPSIDVNYTVDEVVTVLMIHGVQRLRLLAVLQNQGHRWLLEEEWFEQLVALILLFAQIFSLPVLREPELPITGGDKSFLV